MTYRIFITNTDAYVNCEEGSNLREVLQAEGYSLPAYCGGKGICGKCEVFIEGKGEVLSCKVSVQEDMKVTLPKVEKEADAYKIAGHEAVTEKPGADKTEAYKTEAYKIAIDIGTTTLAFSLIEAESGKCVRCYTALNSQNVYGADVLSRIQTEQEGKGRELQSCIQKDLTEGIGHLLAGANLKPEQIEHIAIAGNTAMLHLLRGYSCEGLCRYPFEPKQLGMEELCMKELFVEEVLSAEACKDGVLRDITFADTSVTLLPGMAAFVGADITAGVYACDMRKDKNSVLIDMGTNGEIVLKAGENYYVTSVAAGPAFEGGNILWGTGSVAGAIAGAEMQSEGIHITTIGDKPPVGICGTGLVELIAELLENGIIDATGKLEDAYFEKGYPVAETEDRREIILTQKDIRQFQMAKAALCTGVEMLLKKADLSCEEVDVVYLAGSFGCYLDADKAARTGLIPWELRDKTKAIGNGALLGAEKYVMDIHGTEALENIIKNSIEVTLSMEEEFQERFLENINFR